MTLYEQIFVKIKEKIKNGYYQDEDKLPSIREMSKSQKVSVTTVQEAYRMLEYTGFVYSKNKSGYFIKTPKHNNLTNKVSFPKQIPIEAKHWSEVLELSSKDSSSNFQAFGKGGPNTCLKSLKPIQRIYTDIIKNNPQALYKSDIGKGIKKLRQQVARLLIASGCQVHADEIVITTGCQEAVQLSLKALTKSGDIIAIESPSFHGAIQSYISNDLKILEIPTDPKTGICLSSLQFALEQWPVKVIQLIPTCSNPLGYVMPDSNKEKLYELASEHNVFIIEDDIYGDLYYGHTRPRSIKSFDTDGRVLLCSSFSKTIASGLRVGWVSAGHHANLITHLKYITSLALPTLPQLVMCEYLSEGSYEKHLYLARETYRINRDQIIRWVKDYFPLGTKVSYPEGGYLLWVELPNSADTNKLNKLLNIINIGIAPGRIFTYSEKYQNCFRFNYAFNLESSIEDSVKQIGQEAKKICS